MDFGKAIEKGPPSVVFCDPSTARWLDRSTHHRRAARDRRSTRLSEEIQ